MQINFQNIKHFKTIGKAKDAPIFSMPEIVLAGRSNVGKSSLINALGNNRTLARVSSSPGKTKVIIYFNVDNKFILTDLPGYGYAKADKGTIENFSLLIDNYLSMQRKFDLILFLLDIRHKPSKHDEMMFEFLNHAKIPHLIVLTKTDKLSRSQINKQIRLFREEDYIGDDALIFPVSSNKKSGYSELREFLQEYIDGLMSESSVAKN